MKKIVVFTGAGVSVESGIQTFRDIKDGLWYNYKVDEVATLSGWKKDRSKVLDFHNMLRKKLHDTKPNLAHKLIGKLEKDYDVIVVTQNVDDLHEKGGSTNVLHIHGQLMKCESSADPRLIYDCRGDINIGDKCIKGSQLRPHTVLFGEYPHHFEQALECISQCDYLLVVGTGLDISYTGSMIGSVNDDAVIYYVDPNPPKIALMDFHNLNHRVNFIEEVATVGVKKVYDEIYGNKLD